MVLSGQEIGQRPAHAIFLLISDSYIICLMCNEYINHNINMIENPMHERQSGMAKMSSREIVGNSIVKCHGRGYAGIKTERICFLGTEEQNLNVDL